MFGKNVTLLFYPEGMTFVDELKKVVLSLEMVMNGEEPLTSPPLTEVKAIWLEEGDEKELPEEMETFFSVCGEVMRAHVTNNIMGSCGAFLDGSLDGMYFEF